MGIFKKYGLLLGNISWLFVFQISSYIFPFITLPYLARIFEPQLYGVHVYVVSYLAYFQILWDFGFLLSGTKKCAECKNDRIKLSQIFSSIIWGKIFLFILGFLIIPIICKGNDILNKHISYFYMMYLSFGLNILLPDFLFRGTQNMRVFVSRNLIVRFVSLIMILIFIRDQNDFNLMPIIFFIPNLLGVLWSFYIMSCQLRVTLVIPNMNLIISEFKDSSGFFISRIAVSIYSTSNIILLGYFFPSSAIAVFGIANNLINVMRAFCSPIADAIYPYMIENKNYTLIKKMVLASIPILMIITLLVYILSPRIIFFLFGDKYIESTHFFRAMLPIFTITLPTYLLGYPTLCALNKHSKANSSVIFAALIHLLGLLMLVIAGNVTFNNIILLTIFSEFIVLIVRIYYTRKIFI